MRIKKWEDLPEQMRTAQVRPYYDILRRKQGSLLLKRIFDVTVSGLMLVLLFPLFLILAAAIRLDSPGPVFYRQVRVTQYGRTFRIFKFRSMVDRADRLGTQVTVGNDSRITRVGHFIRRYRLDEVCQLIDVFRGTMTFVGTRPEVPRYVAGYTEEMMATLLLPAGVTSQASIRYKDEAQLLSDARDADKVYMEQVLPEKMEYNLRDIRNFSLGSDLCTLFGTVGAVLGREPKQRGNV